MEEEISENVLFRGTMPNACAYPMQKQTPWKVWELAKYNAQFYNQKEAQNQSVCLVTAQARGMACLLDRS